MNNEIKVLLFYLSAQGREVYVSDILNGHHAMDSEDYEVENFWNAFGGIEIVIDEYCTILHVSDFEFLIKVTNFLLNSLLLVKGRAV